MVLSVFLLFSALLCDRFSILGRRNAALKTIKESHMEVKRSLKRSSHHIPRYGITVSTKFFVGNLILFYFIFICSHCIQYWVATSLPSLADASLAGASLLKPSCKATVELSSRQAKIFESVSTDTVCVVLLLSNTSCCFHWRINGQFNSSIISSLMLCNTNLTLMFLFYTQIFIQYLGIRRFFISSATHFK